MDEKRSRLPAPTSMRVGAAVGFVVVCGLLAFRHFYRVEGIDDAWITYRYAANLAHGLGYVYNSGARVQGTSTPLYTLWLAWCGWLGLPIPEVSTVTAAGAVCVTSALLFLWLRALSSVVAGFAGVCVLLTSWLYLYVVTSGMETSLYIALILGACYAYFQGDSRIAFVLAGLCSVLRLDGICVPLALAVVSTVRERRVPLGDLALPTTLVAAWLLGARLYFGAWLPQSFAAKREHTGHLRFSSWMLHEVAGLGLPLLALAACGLVLVALAPRQRRTLVLAVWWVLYIAAYSLAQIDDYYWYVAPMLLPVYFFAAHAVGRFVLVCRQFPPVPTLLLVLIGAGLLAPTARRQWASATYILTCNGELARYSGARYAAAHVPPGALIASGGIGMIGYATGNPILDFLGLVSPQTVAPYPAPYDYHAVAAVVRAYQPPYVYDAFPAWPSDVTNRYRILAQFPTGCPSLPFFTLWQRR